MKRKLICLVMGILMLLTCVLTACSSKEPTEDTESAIVSDSGARTITMWVMTDPTTTPEAMKAVNEEFSKITKTQFKTNVELRFCTEEFYWKYDAKTGEYTKVVENYYSILERSINETYDLDIERDAHDAAFAQYKSQNGIDAAGEQKSHDLLKEEFYALYPEYQKFADENVISGEEEMVLGEHGVPEIKYPDAEEGQVDIFYIGDMTIGGKTVSGYDKYTEYQKNGWLVSLDDELANASKKLTSYISTSLIEGIKVDGGVYAIPNNRPIGQYTYMMVDKALLRETGNTMTNVNTVLDVERFLGDIVRRNGDTSADDPNYIVPLQSTLRECLEMLVWYWEVEYTDITVYETHAADGREYVLKTEYEVMPEITEDMSQTEIDGLVPEIMITDLIPSSLEVYATNEDGQFVDADGKALDYRYVTEDGAYIRKMDGTIEFSMAEKGMYLVDGSGNPVTAKNDKRVKVISNTSEVKEDEHGNLLPSYYYTYDNDATPSTADDEDFSILGTLKLDAYNRGRGEINLDFSSLIMQKEYIDLYTTLKSYQYNGYYGTPVNGQKAAVSFVKGDASVLAQAEANNGVYTDPKTGREYHVVVAEYPEASSQEMYGNMFAVSAYTASPSRCMEILTYLNTNTEIRDLLQYGIEGVHYTRTSTNETDKYGQSVTKSVVDIEDNMGKNVYRMTLERTGNCFVATPTVEQGYDAWVYAKLQNQSSLVNPLLGFDINKIMSGLAYNLDTDLLDFVNGENATILSNVNTSCTNEDELRAYLQTVQETYLNSSDANLWMLKAAHTSFDPTNPPEKLGSVTLPEDKADGGSPNTIYYQWLENYGYGA